jgi:hypothetical protein
MTDYLRMSTSDLVKLVARGAPSPEDQEAAERELDLRVRPPSRFDMYVRTTGGHEEP